MGIISLLDSYTEISPSGTGLHVIVKSRLPFTGKKGKVFEIYREGRYFTVTGNNYYPAPKTIEQRDDQVFQLLDEYHPELIIGASDDQLIKLVQKNCKNISLIISPWKK